jgi:hypothetical protein
MLQVSSRRIGGTPDCTVCGAGSTISFNWQYARNAKPEAGRDLSVFVKSRDLRFGALYRCRMCEHPWYLCGAPEMMNSVPRSRVDLIDLWNQAPVALPATVFYNVLAVGSTPPDVYGNGIQYREYPCSVVLHSGEQIQMAVVSFQEHAPFEEWRTYRLASEIAAVSPSPHALPLEVRVATSRAEEVRMGFSPTLVELPTGQTVALNWTQSFFVREGCKASDVKLSSRRLDWKNPPTVYNGTSGVVYFVADHELSPSE